MKIIYNIGWLQVQRGKEIREGQHQMALLQLGTTTIWPQYGDHPPPPTPGKLVVFQNELSDDKEQVLI